jgi:hypothetical protein
MLQDLDIENSSLFLGQIYPMKATSLQPFAIDQKLQVGRFVICVFLCTDKKNTEFHISLLDTGKS